MQFDQFPSSNEDTDIRPFVTSDTPKLSTTLGRIVAVGASLILIIAILLVTFGNTLPTKQILTRVGLGPATATRTPVIPTPTSIPTPIPLEQAFPASAIKNFPQPISLDGTNNPNGLRFYTTLVSNDNTLLVGTACISNGNINAATCSISTLNVATQKNTVYYHVPAFYDTQEPDVISDDNHYITFGYSESGNGGSILGIIDTITGAVHVFFNPLNHSNIVPYTIKDGTLFWFGGEFAGHIGQDISIGYIYRMNLQTFVSTELVTFNTVPGWGVSYPYVYHNSTTVPVVLTWVNLEDKTTFTTSVIQANPNDKSLPLVTYKNTVYYTVITHGIFYQLMRQTLPDGKPELLYDLQTDTTQIIAANDHYVVYRRGTHTVLYDIRKNREIKISVTGSDIDYNQLTETHLYLSQYSSNSAMIESIQLP